MIKRLKSYDLLLRVIFILLPFVLFPDLMQIKNDTLLNSLKILPFILALFFVFTYRISFSKRNILIWLITSYYLGITIIMGRSQEDILYTILTIIPFFLLLQSRKIVLSKLLNKYFVLILVVSFVFVLLSPAQYVDNIERWGYIANGPHTSSYSVSIVFFLIYMGFLMKQVDKKYFHSALFFMIILLYGYHVRNAELGMILFFTTYYFYNSKISKNLKNIFIYVFITLFITLSFIVYPYLDIDVNTLSSGRAASWIERINILSNYDVPTLIFGQGYGTDLMETSGWWGIKASHNDFLSLLFNGGLVLLIIYILIIKLLFKSANSFQKGLLFFLLFTSFTNTGLLYRPIQLLYFMLLYVLAQNIQKGEK